MQGSQWRFSVRRAEEEPWVCSRSPFPTFLRLLSRPLFSLTVLPPCYQNKRGVVVGDGFLLFGPVFRLLKTDPRMGHLDAF